MKELSIFVDESGDFGEYAQHAPYYIITMVFHDQANDISQNVNIHATPQARLNLKKKSQVKLA